jgi:hypothetical protein
VTPHGGRGRTGPDIPATARERRRRALVGWCPVPCESRGADVACGLRARAWAGRGKEGSGWARENNADFDLKRISKLNTI